MHLQTDGERMSKPHSSDTEAFHPFSSAFQALLSAPRAFGLSQTPKIVKREQGFSVNSARPAGAEDARLLIHHDSP